MMWFKSLVLPLFAIALQVIIAPVTNVSATCTTRPTVKLYSGYNSSGTTNLIPSVKVVQTKLNARDHAQLKVDGLFGPNTDNAVKYWQRGNGLTVDGTVGSNTWATLCDCRTQNRVPAATSKWGTSPRAIFLEDSISSCFPNKFYCMTLFGSAVTCYPGRSGVKAQGQDKVDGDLLADWAKSNAPALNIQDITWYMRTWTLNKYLRGWTSCGASWSPCYTNSKDPAQAHYDHVHITVQ